MGQIDKEKNHVGSSRLVAALGHIGIRVVLLTGLALPACAVEGIDEEIGEEQAELVTGNGMSLNGMSLNGMSLNGMSLNGMSLNGMSLNGMSLNGMSLNGMSLNGWSLNGMSLNGWSLNGMSLNGSQLGGVTADGQPIAGRQLVGATLVGLLSSGDELPLRIDSADKLPAPNKDVWAYGVSFEIDQGWFPLCGTAESGAQILAVPLAGTWNGAAGEVGGGSWIPDESTFTFACRGAALAKCVEFGYKPWKKVRGQSLRRHHQACTRMLRADYCGDGTSWTANGTQINLYDALGIQLDEATWAVDAEWTADGAICTNQIRDFQEGTPACVEVLEDPACGADFTGGALLINEYEG
jgi:hypothetical protein